MAQTSTMTQPVSAGGPFTDDDARQLARLLARYAEHELEQWERWKVHAPGWGTVYVQLNVELMPGEDEMTYDTVWPLPPRLAEPAD